MKKQGKCTLERYCSVEFRNTDFAKLIQELHEYLVDHPVKLTEDYSNIHLSKGFDDDGVIVYFIAKMNSKRREG